MWKANMFSKYYIYSLEWGKSYELDIDTPKTEMK